MKKICIVTKYSKQYGDMGVISVHNKAKYCAIHGYGLYVSQPMFQLDRPGNWCKLQALEEASKLGYDWLFWSDADSIIMDFKKPLREFTEANPSHLFINCIYSKSNTTPDFYIHLGNFFVRNTPQAMNMLRMAYENPEFENSLMTDEDSFASIYNHLHPDFKTLFKFYPTRTFLTIPDSVFRKFNASKNLDSIVYKEGDFIFHAINEQSNFSIEERTKLLKQYADMR